MISLLQGIWVFLIFIFLILRFKIGIALYLAYIMLVPYMNIKIGGIPLQWNFVNLIVLIVSLYKFKTKNIRIDYKPFVPFLIYFGISFVLMIIQDGVPFHVEFNLWRIQVMKYLILPFALWNEMKTDISTIRLYRNVAIVCIFISVIYGLFLTTIPGVNPYMMLLSEANGDSFNSDYALAFGEGRIFGRISSVYIHPMLFGAVLGLSLIYVFYNRERINKYLFAILFLSIIIDVFVCGVRSVIGGVAVAVVFFFLQARNYKLMIIAAIIGFVGYQIIINIPDLAVYIGSITDVNNKHQAVTGSSIDMRLEQLYGCFKEIQDCLFQGKGFGWTSYYHDIHGDHPIILAFESLIFVVLCNGGIIGIFMWAFMCFKIIKHNNQHELSTSSLLNSLLIFYIAYSCITGEYGYMQFFILFYILMLGENLCKRTNMKK